MSNFNSLSYNNLLPSLTAPTLTFKRGLTPDRAFVLYFLRVNPDHITWTAGALENSLGQMCAAGLACYAFGINRAKNGYDSSEESERNLAIRLEMPVQDVRAIYKLNDNFGLMFEAVADVLDDYFNQPESATGMAHKSLLTVYTDNRSKYRN